MISVRQLKFFQKSDKKLENKKNQLKDQAMQLTTLARRRRGLLPQLLTAIPVIPEMETSLQAITS